MVNTANHGLAILGEREHRVSATGDAVGLLLTAITAGENRLSMHFEGVGVGFKGFGGIEVLVKGGERLMAGQTTRVALDKSRT